VAAPNMEYMMKVLIYSSKELCDNAGFEGRAEAELIAYRREDGDYQVMKNRCSDYLPASHDNVIALRTLRRFIDNVETTNFNRELETISLQGKYKTHPLMELSKND
jgi:hypothetical protein